MAKEHRRERRKSAPSKPETCSPGLGLLFAAACPLWPWLFQGSATAMASVAILMALFALALWLICTGNRIQAAYEAAEVALRPRLPRKVMGSLLVGVFTALLAATQFSSASAAAVCGAVATALCIAAFGVDPFRDKHVDDPAHLLRERIITVTRMAERKLDDLNSRIGGLSDPDLDRRTDAMRRSVMRQLRALAQDPQAMQPLLKPMMKLLVLTLHEADRLNSAWPSDERDFARKRYVAKLAAMLEIFEERARRQRLAAGLDTFELEADQLVDRMARETAA